MFVCYLCQKDKNDDLLSGHINDICIDCYFKFRHCVSCDDRIDDREIGRAYEYIIDGDYYHIKYKCLECAVDEVKWHVKNRRDKLEYHNNRYIKCDECNAPNFINDSNPRSRKQRDIRYFDCEYCGVGSQIIKAVLDFNNSIR